MAISYPLDPDAVAAADDRFYERYPEMIDANGNRIPLSASNTDEHEMHEDWCRFYEEELAKKNVEEDDDDPGEGGDGDTVGTYPLPPEGGEEFPTTPPDPVEGCPDCRISFDLMYVDQEDCPGVGYAAVLTDSSQAPTTGTVPKVWDPIPPGTCEFSRFDFHKPGKDATKPAF